MKIEILDSAQRDLIEGFEFYEKQQEGFGDGLKFVRRIIFMLRTLSHCR